MTAALELTDAEAREQARQTWLEDPTISGAELGRRYGRDPRWGSKWIRIWKAENGTVVPIRTAPERAVSTPKQPPMHASARHSGRPPHVPKIVHVAAHAGVGLVAGITALASYEHMRHLADANGQGWMSYLLPVAVDGMMLVATMVAMVRRGRNQRAALAWACLVLGVVVSIVANVASAYQLPAWTEGVISAWPPLFLLLSIELLLQLRNPKRGNGK